MSYMYNQQCVKGKGMYFHRSIPSTLLSRFLYVLVLMTVIILIQAVQAEEHFDRVETLPAGVNQPSSLTAIQLQELVGPIALYPDDLIAVILSSTTKPIQLVQAVRFLEEHKNDPELAPDDSWDDSVIALLNYPEVLRLLDGNLEWTVKLGEAVINQQEDIMDAIQLFRKRANEADNLVSDDKLLVIKNDDTIQIKPTDPQVIYLPDYEPERVVVRNYYPVYDYYPTAYPLYYYPYAPDYRFSSRFFWGVTTAFVIGWNTHHLYSYGNNNRRHPYYGSQYYVNRYLYRNSGISRRINLNRGQTVANFPAARNSHGLRSLSIGSPVPRRQSVRQRSDNNRTNRNNTGYTDRHFGQRTAVIPNRNVNRNRNDRFTNREIQSFNDGARRRHGWNRNALVNHGQRNGSIPRPATRAIRLTPTGSNSGSDNNSIGEQSRLRLNLRAGNNERHSTNNYNHHRRGTGNTPQNSRRGRLRR